LGDLAANLCGPFVGGQAHCRLSLRDLTRESSARAVKWRSSSSPSRAPVPPAFPSKRPGSANIIYEHIRGR
jgi:hypothetical protein